MGHQSLAHFLFGDRSRYLPFLYQTRIPEWSFCLSLGFRPQASKLQQVRRGTAKEKNVASARAETQDERNIYKSIRRRSEESTRATRTWMHAAKLSKKTIRDRVEQNKTVSMIQESESTAAEASRRSESEGAFVGRKAPRKPPTATNHDLITKKMPDSHFPHRCTHATKKK